MNLCLLFLAARASAIITPSPALDLNSTFNYGYHCRSSAEHDVGHHRPTALDCLNVLTFVLATTPNHKQQTHWSRSPHDGNNLLPYSRNSGTCQLLVQFRSRVPPGAVDTASVDQVVAAALRIIEICLLAAVVDEEPAGGIARIGMSRYLNVLVWGAPNTYGAEGTSSNETIMLNASGAGVNLTAQS